MSKVPITNLERGGITVWKIMDLFKCAIKKYAKILATILERVMDKLVNRDQVGFMRHKIITDSMKKSFMLIQIDGDTQIPVFANPANIQKEWNKIETA